MQLIESGGTDKYTYKGTSCEEEQMVRILLVEDDNMIASGIQYALEMENYEVRHVINIHDALAAINKADFNLAILDMQLPDGVGFEVSEKLKTVNTAIIFLTVVDDENTIVNAFDDGATDYIVKPFRIGTFWRFRCPQRL